MKHPRAAQCALASALLLSTLGRAQAAPAPSVHDAPPPPGQASSFATPVVRDTKLRNGTRVLVVERHDLPVVSMRIVSDVGATRAVPGAARMAARVVMHGGVDSTLLAGAPTPPSSSRSDAYVWFDRTEIETKVLANAVDDALSYMAGLALRPAWRSENVERVRRSTLEGLHGPTTDVFDLAYAASYPRAHPLHAGLLGSEVSVEHVSLDALRAYWNQAFSRGHVTVIVVGDVRVAPLLEALERELGDLPEARVAAPQTTPVSPSPRRAIALRPSGGSQAKVIVSTLACSSTSPDYYPMRILDGVLGGGMTSRLFNIRGEHGVTYGVFSDLTTRADGGLLTVHGAVEREHTGETVRRILTELERLSTTPLSPEELERAKTQVEHHIPAGWETADGLADSIAGFVARGVPLSELAAFDEHVNAVTAEQVMAVAKKYAAPANVAITIIGPRDVGAQLDAQGLGPWEIVKP